MKTTDRYAEVAPWLRARTVFFQPATSQNGLFSSQQFLRIMKDSVRARKGKLETAPVGLSLNEYVAFSEDTTYLRVARPAFVFSPGKCFTVERARLIDVIDSVNHSCVVDGKSDVILLLDGDITFTEVLASLPVSDRVSLQIETPNLLLDGGRVIHCVDSSHDVAKILLQRHLLKGLDSSQGNFISLCLARSYPCIDSRIIHRSSVFPIPFYGTNIVETNPLLHLFSGFSFPVEVADEVIASIQDARDFYEPDVVIHARGDKPLIEMCN